MEPTQQHCDPNHSETDTEQEPMPIKGLSIRIRVKKNQRDYSKTHSNNSPSVCTLVSKKCVWVRPSKESNHQMTRLPRQDANPSRLQLTSPEASSAWDAIHNEHRTLEGPTFATTLFSFQLCHCSSRSTTISADTFFIFGFQSTGFERSFLRRNQVALNNRLDSLNAYNCLCWHLYCSATVRLVSKIRSCSAITSVSTFVIAHSKAFGDCIYIVPVSIVR